MTPVLILVIVWRTDCNGKVAAKKTGNRLLQSSRQEMGEAYSRLAAMKMER